MFAIYSLSHDNDSDSDDNEIMFNVKFVQKSKPNDEQY